MRTDVVPNVTPPGRAGNRPPNAGTAIPTSFWTISHVFPSPIPTPRAPRVVLCVVPMRIDADWYWCLQSDGVFRFTSSGPGHPAAERRVPRAVQNVSFASALTPCAHTTPPLFGCVVSVLAFPASRIFARNDQKSRLAGGFCNPPSPPFQAPRVEVRIS